LCGSDSAFGGRDTYFKTHGNYEIFDLYTARERGYIAEDYLVWWGYEDKILFDIAKDEINALAKGDQPFNFTMLTVDAHHVDGYKCNVCQDTYEENLANVINCTDRLVRDFVEWCREQPFYEDTVIVIMGDHPRMDTSLVKDVDFYDRTMYNCILNCDTEIKGEVKNRVFTCFDMFPTTLAALGFEIAGERLGLGTNLFSDLPTLAEELGYEWLNEEVGKFSQYYVDHFT
jgi:phosphoglycerol transferase